MANASTSKLNIVNSGTRRIILGPPAKSQSGGKVLRPTLLGTQDDAKIRTKAKDGEVPPMHVTLEGDEAKRWASNGVLKAAGESFGLKVG